eukprot:CAMPEP_0197190874 /NCGR_PEP_ID=MMETSP1423-20130617/22414_1 /TAXON_ID=476441 /ORGANISM="Pseudo-nitzschia heimii, Strain UNC1101" /LENGTH=309 /DNA_ID=CAMNT_0042643351 /DNA_START=73 /DNA_END=999 /DNA_ORIENTATION=-
MVVDYSRYQTNDIIKLQAFVRGSLCRDRVVKMVEKLIDEILTRLGKPVITKPSHSNISGGALGIKRKSVTGTDNETKSPNAARRELTINDKKSGMVIDPIDNSSRSISSIEIKANEVGDSVGINEESAHGSISSIRSLFESKNDSNAPVTTRSWSKRKLEVRKNEEEIQEDKQDKEHPISQDQKSSETIEKTESMEEEGKDSELPAPQKQKTNPYLKNLQLRSNATKNVSSSAKVLEEQDMRMNEEIKQLLKDIRRIGDPDEPSVAFGELFDDEKVANYYEALVGTLKAAKKKKLIAYDGQFLLKGMSD